MTSFESQPNATSQDIGERFARRAVWLPVLIIAPFVVLLFCTSPHMDDFCFGAMWLDRGLAGMLRDLYLGFQGRLFGAVGMAGPVIVQHTLGVDLLVVYRVFCAAALGTTVVLALWAAGALLPGSSGAVRLFIGLALAVALVAGGPQPEDNFYFVMPIACYTIPAIAALWLMIWLYRRAATGAALGRPATVLLTVGGMVLATNSEFSGPVLFVIVLGSLLQRRLTPHTPRQPIAHAVILVGIAVATTIVALAPGNAVRMHLLGTDQGMPLRILAAFPMSVVHLAQFLFRRLTNPALLAWLLVLVLVTSAHDRRSRATSVAACPRLVIWLPLVLALVAICGSLWIGHVGTGRLLEQRALGHLHFVLVGGLALTAVAATHAYGEQVGRLIAARWPRVTARRAALAALLLMLITPNFLQASRLLLEVGPIYRSVQHRFALLGDGKAPGAPTTDRELVLPPLFLPPLLPAATSWFGDWLNEDPEQWPNACLARYAGVRSVRIEMRPSPSD